ncbi:Hypothetical predicted protein [Octopus vulgaris]|uniref:Uncharacterized protein n=1 Tax=Octopus vulgaris TaxID=6645 RepID=A0AA36MI16_OCTVU|nr:Hypothetical predicted protein [Octopus vulgaris]
MAFMYMLFGLLAAATLFNSTAYGINFGQAGSYQGTQGYGYGGIPGIGGIASSIGAGSLGNGISGISGISGAGISGYPYGGYGGIGAGLTFPGYGFGYGYPGIGQSHFSQLSHIPVTTQRVHHIPVVNTHSASYHPKEDTSTSTVLPTIAIPYTRPIHNTTTHKPSTIPIPPTTPSHPTIMDMEDMEDTEDMEDMEDTVMEDMEDMVMEDMVMEDMVMEDMVMEDMEDMEDTVRVLVMVMVIMEVTMAILMEVMATTTDMVIINSKRNWIELKQAAGLLMYFAFQLPSNND